VGKKTPGANFFPNPPLQSRVAVCGGLER
jgi:hypothetical protein